ncbi:MAG TPA: UdgX family uracil-DNA binding protein [Steroidobacteraceae bacterium]|nr:UdgX family uracil-DNA binding protein [Steroidobacteraceae bacterium]
MRFPPTESFFPDRLTLPALRAAAAHCRGCPLYINATQTVFGAGSTRATLLMVGEQPGDREDLEGKPFVGPAGRLLDEALASAGIERRQVYVTNAVKHFNFERRGKFRLHKRPPAGAIKACLPWLEAELEVVKPQVVVLLGATAAQALFGASFRITRERGRVLTHRIGRVVATLHPSAILRAPDEAARAQGRKTLVADLKLAARTARRTAVTA